MKVIVVRVCIIVFSLIIAALTCVGTWVLLNPDWTITRLMVMCICVFELMWIITGAVGLWMLTED